MKKQQFWELKTSIGGKFFTLLALKLMQKFSQQIQPNKEAWELPNCMLIFYLLLLRAKHFQKKQLKSSSLLSANLNLNHFSSSQNMQIRGGKTTKISVPPTKPDWLRFLQKLMIETQVCISQFVQWFSQCLRTDYQRLLYMLLVLYHLSPSKDLNVLERKELKCGTKFNLSSQEVAVIQKTMLFYYAIFSQGLALRHMCASAQTLKGLTHGS